MTSWGVVRRRIRRPRISKRNGKRKVSRRICTPVPRGKEASSRRNLLLPSRPQLPNQQYPLLHQRQWASLSCLQPLHLLLLTPHRLLLQPWRLILQTNRTNRLYLAGGGKTMPVFRQSNCPHVWDKSGLSGYLVCLVHLVSLMPPHKPDRPNRPHEQDRLADFFSILLE